MRTFYFFGGGEASEIFFVLVEYRSDQPKDQRRKENGGKNRKEKQLNRGVAYEICTEDSSEHRRHDTDYYIHEKDSAAAKHAGSNKPFKNTYQSPNEPYEQPGMTRRY